MDKQNKSFEASLKSLEEIVEKLETGQLSLDESIKLYKKGVDLNQNCEKQLKLAEDKIAALKKSLEQENTNTEASSKTPLAMPLFEDQD